MTRLTQRRIGTRNLARSAAARFGRVRRQGPQARSVAPPQARLSRTSHLAALILLVSGLALSGCGTSEESASAPPDYEEALAGAPPPLAALHEQANELLPGGVDAFERRLEALRGYPVVINLWASWCGPCRLEFPHFQRLAAELGKRVAFLGVDVQDSEEAAARFLDETPVPYPSFVDPEGRIAESMGAGLGLPATAFYDRQGEQVHLKRGPYASAEELRADVERHALAGSRDGGG